MHIKTSKVYPLRLLALSTLAVGMLAFAAGCGGGAREPAETAEAEGGREGMWGLRTVRRAFRGSGGQGTDADPETDAHPHGGVDDPSLGGSFDTPVPFGSDPHNERIDDVFRTYSDPDYDEAIRLVQGENFVQARAVFLRIAERNPADSEAWRWIGDCNYNLMELHKALEAYQEARRLNPDSYFALRGEGLTRLHYGHELWRTGKQREAHEQYRRSLEILQRSTRQFPGDMDAMYGRAMAAEGASRLLYMNALVLLGRRDQHLAERELRNCLDVIVEGIQAAEIVTQNMMDAGQDAAAVGPLNISGGLYQRHATLLHTFKHDNDALQSMQLASEHYRRILQIDPTNLKAQEELTRSRAKLQEWAEAR